MSKEIIFKSTSELLLYLMDIDVNTNIDFSFNNKTYNSTYYGILDNNIILLSNIIRGSVLDIRKNICMISSNKIPNIKTYKHIHNILNRPKNVNFFYYTSEFNQDGRIIYNQMNNSKNNIIEGYNSENEMLNKKSDVLIYCYELDYINVSD